jgi:hypothetical protein
MTRRLRWVCVGVVVAACHQTGDDLFRRLPDAAGEFPGVTADAGVDARVDASGDVDIDAGEADAFEADALDLDAAL